jgi:Zn-dependent peptidase ImmA (M78 family)
MKNVLRDLRDLVPLRPLSYGEAIRVAELQANRFLEKAELTTPPVPETIISTQPKCAVVRMTPLPVSGAAHWAKSRWLIVVNGAEPATRQRYSIAHEFKHVIDHPFIKFLYPEQVGMTTTQRAEQVADYFAACLLMPKAWVKRIYFRDLPSLPELAGLFGVSQLAMSVRLQQLGITEAPSRCGVAA